MVPKELVQLTYNNNDLIPPGTAKKENDHKYYSYMASRIIFQIEVRYGVLNERASSWACPATHNRKLINRSCERWIFLFI